MPDRRVPSHRRLLLVPSTRQRLWLGMILAVAGPLAATPLATLPGLDRVPAIPFILAVVAATVVGRLLSGLIGVVVSAVLLDWYVVPPLHSLRPSAEELWALLMFGVVSGTVAELIARHERATEATLAERSRLDLLAGASKLFGSSADHAEALQQLARLLVPGWADWCAIDVVTAPGRIDNVTVAHPDPELLALVEELRRRHPPDVEAETGVANVLRTGRSELYRDIPVQRLEAQALDDDERAVVGRLRLRSALVVPLAARGESFGTMTLLRNDRSPRFTETDLGLAEEIAEWAALSVDNARLYGAEREARAAAERESRRTSVLQEVTSALSGAATVEEVASALLDRGLAAAGARAGVVGIVDRERATVEVIGAIGYEKDHHEYWERFPLTGSYPLSDAIRNRQRVVLESRSERDARYPDLADAGWPGDHTMICLPFLVSGAAIGGFTVSFPRVRPIDEDEMQFLEAIAGQGAQALDRARLYEAGRLAATRLDVLSTVSQALASTLDYDKTMRQVAELGAAYLADAAALYIAERDSIRAVALAHTDPGKQEHLELVLSSHVSMRGDDGNPIAAAMQTGLPQVIAASSSGPPSHLIDPSAEGEAVESVRPLSGLVLPLAMGGHVLGALVLLDTESAREYHEDTVAFAGEVARRMARAIENARLYRERDHVAMTFQQSLLPPALPDIPLVEVAALFHPALAGLEIGGDFYDVFETPSGDWALVIGDVCGKGVEAAAVTGLTRYTIRGASRAGRPSDVLRTLNNALLTTDLEGRFCTACYVRLRPSPGDVRITVAVGGHPLPQIIRRDGTIEPVGELGTLLGVMEEVSLHDVEARLGEGDSLLLYTDGLLEKSEQPLVLGGRLAEILRAGPRESAADIRRSVEDYVAGLSAEQQYDDIAVLIVQAVPAPAESQERQGEDVRGWVAPSAVAVSRH
jgi:GAF domain-containing protein